VWRLLERRRQSRAQALSAAIRNLPPGTRRAMLDAMATEELLVGAYTDRQGRMCPMLAAHRRGVRYGSGAFPRAWDAFARATRPRPATERELAILRALLEESLSESVGADAPGPTPSRRPAAAPAAEGVTVR
jgi:hypothetical protein